jgi:TonB-linked SusC/RagA family outer membrane protein
MKKTITLLAFLLAVVCMRASAQDRTITGKVTSSLDSLGIPGVSVVVVGTTVGTTTDIDGNYQLTVPSSGKQIRLSGIGLKAKTIDLSDAGTYSAVMEPDVLRLEEVVVTALNIPTERRRLSYAVQSISGENVSNVGQQNVVNSFAGKIAGAQVTSSSGTPGAASYIVLRGPSSILGENQPLFVVDGVPFDNSHQGGGNPDNGTNNNLIGSTGAVTNSNRAIDLNPDDIESISVLKGPAATALYGSAASSGAIVITTKKGKYTPGKKINVRYSAGLTWDEVNKEPEMQNIYVQGTGGNYRAPETGASGSWGPKASAMSWDGDATYKFDKHGHLVLSSDPSAREKFVPYDNFDQFFRTGKTFEHSFSMTGGSEISAFRLSLSRLDQDGIVPLSDFKRTTVGISGDSKISKRFSASGSVTYTNSGGRRIQQGSNLSGLMLDLLRTPISFDNSNGNDDPEAVDAYQFDDGTQRNYRGGGGYDNPYWTINKNPYTDDVNRMFGTTQITYLPHSWLSISYRLGGDFYSDRRKQVFAFGSRNFPEGQLQDDQYFNRTVNGDLLVRGETKLSNDFKGSLLVGHNIYSNYYQQLFTQGDGLLVPEYSNVINAASVFSREQHFRKRRMGVYADAKIEFRDMLYVDITARNDYSSTLASTSKDYGSFFYPSVSAGFVFTEALKMNNNKVLPYGKLRAAYAEAGKDADPYSTRDYYNTQVFADGWTTGITYPINGVPGFTSDDYKGNPELKPEKTKAFEVGTELRFLKNRIGLDVTYYIQKTEDILLQLPIAGSTGWPYRYQNAATMENKGVEIILATTPLIIKNFKWDLTINWAQNKNEITKLYPGVENVFLGGFEGSDIRAVEGEAYGSIYGGYFITDDGTPNGQMIIDDDPASSNYGYPISSPQNGVIGNTQPDWTGGITSTFTWKRLSLMANFYIREGGEIWNGTKGALIFFGRAKVTENRGEMHVFEGVAGHLDEDGNVVTSGATNGVSVPLDQAWYQFNGGGFGSVAKPFIEDGSFVKLREVSLTYSFNPKIFKNTIVQGIDVSAVGRNLWLSTDYTGVDPETSLVGAFNAQGMDYFNNPGTRSYGGKVTVTF